MLELQTPVTEQAPQKINFYNRTRAQLEKELMGAGKERFRAAQLFSWVYRKGITDIDQMTNLSKEFREQLKIKFDFNLPSVANSVASRDHTRKLLINVGEGKTVESVMIPSEDRMTLCVSSEIGCNMACQFCFTGKQKLQRRLDVFEIVGQFMRAQAELPETHKLTNIVFMGMGEPLDNLAGVFGAIDVICDDHGLNFSRKKITVSTSGLVPQIPEVAKAGVRLAVSLNASSDEMRDIIMPINKRYPLKELMQACKEYYDETKDRITFEYVLLKGVNDTLEDARRVNQIVRGVPCKLNLIPFNEHEGSEFVRPEMSAVLKFQNELIRLGHSVFIRRTMGRDIYAACGQLRSKFENHPSWRKETSPVSPSVQP
ncbi:MAG: 23S rRNA (adenine(2503)-C(2))-methyltransferase RlmN [Bdellovibrionales bacterium]